MFGLLINMPIISYYEVGTTLTPRHGHAAWMGVFGIPGLALLTFALRQVTDDKKWASLEKYIRVGFWGLNVGLLPMVMISLFPGGILQMVNVLNNGYWHTRSPDFLGGSLIKFIEWIRIVPDFIFGIVGVIPVVLAALLTYRTIRKQPATA